MNGKTILLVEDDAIIALAEAAVLKRHGAKVITAYSGKQAIEAVALTPEIDLVLMDIELGSGQMDGTQAAQIILEQHDLPLVFLSSHTEPDVVSKTEAITSYGYIVKNSGETVLAASIKMAFKLHAAQQALRKTNETLSLALEASRAGTWDWDILHNVFDWSPEFRDVFGMEAGTVAGFAAWMQTLHPQDREMAARRIQEAIEQHTPLVVDYRILRPDGETRWIRATGRTYYAGEQPARMAGLCVDITELKQAEMLRQESEAHAQALLEAVPDLIFRLDRQGVFLDYKADIRDLYTPREASIIGKRNRDLTPPEFAGLIEDKIQLTLATGQMQTFEYQLPIPERGVRDYEARMVASGADDVTVIVRDVTERKRAEEALRASETLYRTVLHTATAGFVIADLQGRLLEVNEAYCRMSGYSAPELLEMNISDLDAFDDAAAVRARSQKIVTQGEDRFETRHRRKDGSCYDVAASVKYEPECGPRIIGFLQDITARKRGEAALEKVAQEKQRLLQEFLHRVKNSFVVLNSLIGFMQTESQGQEARAALSQLKEYMGAFSELYDLLYANDTTEEVQLGDYCARITRALVRLPNIRLRQAYEAVTVPVSIATPVGLILTELITNAIKHAFPAERGGSISIALRQGDGTLVLAVCDDGVGLPPQFELASSRSMGMTLLQGLTSQIEGRLQIEVDGGTRCTIEFPR